MQTEVIKDDWSKQWKELFKTAEDIEQREEWVREFQTELQRSQDLFEEWQRGDPDTRDTLERVWGILLDKKQTAWREKVDITNRYQWWLWEPKPESDSDSSSESSSNSDSSSDSGSDSD